MHINPTQILIRQSTFDDLPQILQLLTDDVLGKNREIYQSGQPIPKCYLNAYKQIQQNPENLIIVMEYNNKIIGTLQLIFIPSLTLQGCLRAEIEGVRIDPSYRGIGLGKRLINWAKTKAIEHGCKLLQLTTNQSRTEAHNFYTSLGFKNTHFGFKMKL